MTIDWFTVSAEVINFLILVFLLKKFLYHPIVNTIERRKERMAEREETIERLKQETEEMKATYEQKHAALEQSKADLLAEAKKEADRYRRQLQEQAKISIKEQKQAWERDLAEEQQRLGQAFQEKLGDLFTETLQKALRDLSHQELERHIIQMFLQQLQSADVMNRDEDAPVIVTTAFSLQEETKAMIRASLRDMQGHAPLQFQQNKELIGGITLTIGDQTFSWHISQYVHDLADRIKALGQGNRSETHVSTNA